MARVVALANCLQRGELRWQTSDHGEWRVAMMALFSHALGVVLSSGGEADTVGDASGNVKWAELLRVDAIDSVRPDDCAMGWRFSVTVAKAASEDATPSDAAVGEEAIEFCFEAVSESERTEWIRALLLAKQLAAVSHKARRSSDALYRFMSSGSEDCDSDSVDGDAEGPLSRLLHSPVGTARGSMQALTIVHVSVTGVNSKTLSVSVPLSGTLRRNSPLHQIKLHALRELRQASHDAEKETQAFLRHEADWFVLCTASDNVVWLKEEQMPVTHYIPTSQVIHLRLEPVSAMPFPTIQLAITSTKNKVSDLSQRTYTAYVIDVTFNDMKWQVQRRFKEFHKLHHELKEKHSILELPKLPPKHVFTPTEGEFVNKRRQQLEMYMRSLIDHPHISHDVLVLSFLGVVSTSRDRELSKNVKSVIHVTALHVGLDFGDIILFSCRFGASVLQRKVTGAKYDHVGIVVPGASRNLLRILEATGEGIQVYSLKARLMAYSREVSKAIVVRRFSAKRTEALRRRMEEFVKRVEGNPYSILGILQTRAESERQVIADDTNRSPTMTSTQSSSPSYERRPPTPTRRGSTGMLPLSPIQSSNDSSQSPKRKYFCSSLAAAALKHIGWLGTTHTSSYFWPGSFEEGGEIERYLTPGVLVGPETTVDCKIIEVGLATSTNES